MNASSINMASQDEFTLAMHLTALKLHLRSLQPAVAIRKCSAMRAELAALESELEVFLDMPALMPPESSSSSVASSPELPASPAVAEKSALPAIQEADEADQVSIPELVSIQHAPSSPVQSQQQQQQSAKRPPKRSRSPSVRSEPDSERQPRRQRTDQSQSPVFVDTLGKLATAHPDALQTAIDVALQIVHKGRRGDYRVNLPNSACVDNPLSLRENSDLSSDDASSSDESEHTAPHTIVRSTSDAAKNIDAKFFMSLRVVAVMLNAMYFGTKELSQYLDSTGRFGARSSTDCLFVPSSKMPGVKVTIDLASIREGYTGAPYTMHVMGWSVVNVVNRRSFVAKESQPKARLELVVCHVDGKNDKLYGVKEFLSSACARMLGSCLSNAERNNILANTTLELKDGKRLKGVQLLPSELTNYIQNRMDESVCHFADTLYFLGKSVLQRDVEFIRLSTSIDKPLMNRIQAMFGRSLAF